MASCFAELDECGLNRQAVLAYEQLPETMQRAIAADFPCDHARRQLILIGNAGPLLWRSLQHSGWQSAEPIDDFSLARVERWFARCCPGHNFTVLFPSATIVGLQRLGELAGWHQPAPFMLGIDAYWGSWFAYRVALLSDTALPLRTAPLAASPCARCAARPCVAACPPRAMGKDGFDMQACANYRLQADSACRYRCVARDACPVGQEHRYDEAQLRHGYGRSLAALQAYAARDRG